ncbi:MAG: bifunctional hydroxymethylpyrimidine kinase/phosphomethylpyrimidine kinase [Deltaproteobacteria bacterium]|nr:bifunctional hydroxymethylpyrimidine kinase/phosphomethylpyrimidine kinase [Deltaproteobacteria bacterium]
MVPEDMVNRKYPPVILAFGGYDPTGGAGVLMDAVAIRAAGGHAAAVPSCLAIQSTSSFDRMVPLPRAAMDSALDCAVKSFRIMAVKIGMVGTRAAAESIHNFLFRFPEIPVVLDPVLRSSTGAPLLAAAALPAFRKVLCRADLITPNLPEIEKILDRKVGSFGEAIVAARDLSVAAGAAVVLKGGHFPWKGKRGIDIVFEKRRVTPLAPGAGLRRADAHGTGCALASAIAARLAAGDPVVEAARTAKALVEGMIASGFPSAEGRWTLFG